MRKHDISLWHLNWVVVMKKVYIYSLIISIVFLCITNISHARYIISNIQRSIQSYEQEIENIKRQARIFDIKKDMAKVQKEIDDFEKKYKIPDKKYKIPDIKTRKLTAEIQRDIQAINVYSSAVTQAGNLFAELNSVIYEIYNDPGVKIKLNKILQLQREVKDRIRKKVDEMQKVGRDIDQVTIDAQKQLKTTLAALLPVEQELKLIYLSPEVDEKIKPLKNEMIELQEKMNKAIDRLPTSLKNQIERLKNAIRRLEIVLEYIRNPELIQAASEDQVLGIEKK